MGSLAAESARQHYRMDRIMNGTFSTITPVVALTGLLAAIPGWAQEQADPEHREHEDIARYFSFQDDIANSVQSRSALTAGASSPRKTDFGDAAESSGVSAESGRFGLNDEMLVTRPLGRGALSVRVTSTPDGEYRAMPYSPGSMDDRRDAVAASGVTGALSGSGASQRSRNIYSDIAASYVMRLGAHGAVSGSLGLPGTPALGPSESRMQRYMGADERYAPFMSDWLYAGNIGQGVVTFGYSWRNFRFESSTFGRRDRERPQDSPSLLRMESQSRRLSFKPTQDWTLQFSRGQIGSLDQLDPSREIKRSTVSATFTHQFNDAALQSIFAWGRNTGKNFENTKGYLVESTLRLATAHAFFGRMEQIGGDNTLRENTSLQRQSIQMNKLTFGYAYNVPTASAVKYDVGGLVTRNYGLASMPASYSSDRMSYLMFIRFKLK
jgi:hypothetical protein